MMRHLATIACALALAPLQREAGIARVAGTHLQPASGAGRDGVRALEGEVVALFNQSSPLTAAITSSAQKLGADQDAPACPQCGAQIVTDAKFCNQCGNSLTD